MTNSPISAFAGDAFSSGAQIASMRLACACTEVVCTEVACTEVACTEVICTEVACTEVVCTELIGAYFYDCAMLIGVMNGRDTNFLEWILWNKKNYMEISDWK